jgi:hypothetical protein
VSNLPGTLTRNLGGCSDDVRDEIMTAMEENIQKRELGMCGLCFIEFSLHVKTDESFGYT